MAPAISGSAWRCGARTCWTRSTGSTPFRSEPGPPASTAIRAPTASRPPTASKLKEGRRPAAIRAGRQTPPRPGPQAPALSLVAPTPCASGRTQQSGPGLVAAAALGQVQRLVGGFHQHAGRLIGLWPGHGEADADGELPGGGRAGKGNGGGLQLPVNLPGDEIGRASGREREGNRRETHAVQNDQEE